MYGGQSFPCWEYDLAKYVAKSFLNHILEGFDDYFDTDLFSKNVDKSHFDDFFEEHKTLICELGKKYIYDLVSEFEGIKIDDELFDKIWDRALKKTDKETHQAMQAVLHNLNTMQCLPEDEHVITLDIKKIKNIDCMTNIEKDALKELLIKLYNSMTIQEIAFELQCSKKIIRKCFKLFGIKSRNKKETAQFMKTRYIEKYGVENPMQLSEIKKKVKNTQFKKYGKFAFNTSKQKETNLERYGYENPMQNETIKERLFQTNIKKYGNKCSLVNDNVKNKTKKTNLEKYGVENVLDANSPIRQKIDYSMTNEHLSKIARTKQKRYGGNFCDSKIIREKCEKTCLEKYGTKTFPFFMYVKHTSKNQLAIFNYLKNQFPNLEIQLNVNGIMSEKPFYELDIWIPLLRIGIEYNGVYWHDKNKYLKDISENTVNSKERLKDMLSVSNNFTLIHIWEDDYDKNEDEVKNYLNNIIITAINNLGVSND